MASNLSVRYLNGGIYMQKTLGWRPNNKSCAGSGNVVAHSIEVHLFFHSLMILDDGI